MKNQTNKTVAIIIIAAMALTVTAGFARNKQAEPTTMEVVSVKTTGRIEGVVKDVETGKPIKNAVICVEGCKVGAMTNERGKFFLKNVPCGSCTLKVSKAGYELAENVLLVKDGKRATLSVTLKQQAG
ncbi:carboxypeptidase-like regulatory domain-containing protein [bacterium]|nr:carboxypeptidase-like regulatory domain-containing protein [bacterium]